MKDSKNFIPETEFNEDDATTLRNAEIMSADSVDAVWSDSMQEESADAEDEDDNTALEIEIYGADGELKRIEAYSKPESFFNATGKGIKKVVRVIKAGATLGLSETKKGKKVSAKVDEKMKKVGKKIGSDLKKAGRVFKKVNLLPVRAAFLSLSAINIFGSASHLKTVKDAGDKGDKTSKDKWEKAKNFWFKLGGDRAKFEKNILKGASRKPFLAKVKKKKGADGSTETVYLFAQDENYEEWQNVAGVDDAAIAAWVGLASSVIVAVKKIAGKPKEMDAETEAAMEQDAAENAGDFDASVAEEEKNATPEALRDVGNTPGIPEAFKKVLAATPKWAWFAIGGAVLVGVFFLIRSLTKKK